MKEKINVVSLGVGKQSIYMLLRGLAGEFKYKPDYAIFSDTESEPDYVYEQLEWVVKYCMDKYNFEILFARGGNLMLDIENYVDGLRDRVAMIPLFLENRSMVSRQCTMDYKIAPLRKVLQKIRSKNQVRLWIGISLDEMERMKDSPVKYIEHWYPLVENRISIDQIINYYSVNSLPEPGKSACLICPFHSFEYWSLLKRYSKKDFERACVFDDKIRNYPKLKHRAYISRQLKPLREIDFSQHPSLFPDMIEECHGLCGL
jgi:hypothetical protein